MRALCSMPQDIEYSTPISLRFTTEQWPNSSRPGNAVSQNGNLYYWSRFAKSSSAEVDYIASINGSIVPVEIKSAAEGRLKSLHLSLIPIKIAHEACVFISSGNEFTKNRLEFLPLYWQTAPQKSDKNASYLPRTKFACEDYAIF